MDLTTSQKEAIAARGNVLVVAGAGTGKTKTLVERCLNCLKDAKSPASIDQMLIVTFTEAAALEVRQRIRAELERLSRENPASERWQEQLALFETAHIGTLHSFCLRLVKQHFYELGIDPQLAVLPEEEANLLAEETLSTILDAHYSGESGSGSDVQELISLQGGGSDKAIRRLVERLHKYSQTLPNPEGWIDDELRKFAAPDPACWMRWLLTGLADWRERWISNLAELASTNPIAHACHSALGASPALPSRAEGTSLLRQIATARQDCPKGKKTAWVSPLTKFFDETDFLASFISLDGKPDPLTEDWDWVRHQMSSLLLLAREFTTAFAESKRELGMVDFHDLEQFALRLLWDSKKEQPTKIAELWRRKLHYLFVDEYQDINQAQDKIIEALGREGSQANRFLVGDAKQSIYRFRLAAPHIFQNYVKNWPNQEATSIALVENFRSRKGILAFINSVFEKIMCRELGGIQYDERARLVFGGPQETGSPDIVAAPATAAELHIRLKGQEKQTEPEEESNGNTIQKVDLDNADLEARFVAMRLQQLKQQSYLVWDHSEKRSRSVEWKDMAILLRSPKGKSDSYAKEFARLEIPLIMARGGFYQSLEISDLLSLLRLLDNPLQDIPTLAVLRSPLVGLTLDELAVIRLAARGRFWKALVRWNDQAVSEAANRASDSGNVNEAETRRKVSTFLERYARWRRLSRQSSLSNCLEAILSETHYASWLLTQPRGPQRHANVRRLIGLAQQFDQFKRQSLYRFLCFIEAQEAAEVQPEVAPQSSSNAVRLLSIHQSKGLEFPVVVVADLGKSFNLADLRSEIILDEEYGLCPHVKPPHTGKRYPSLPFWLARQRQSREMLGEELRLLYVAMTRARDLLILTGAISRNTFDKFWNGSGRPGLAELCDARCFADWLGCWFAGTGAAENALEGVSDSCHWKFYPDPAWTVNTAEAGIAAPGLPAILTQDDASFDALFQRLVWKYPHLAATQQAAKSSVTSLRRLASESEDDESQILFQTDPSRPRAKLRSEKSSGPGSAAELGSLHHRFMQLVSLARTGSRAELAEEIRRMTVAGVFTPDEASRLDLEALLGFWNSVLGADVRSNSKLVTRELAFTARFSPAELAAVTGGTADPELEDDFVVVQGVADLVVCLPKELWVIDFKTDRVEQDALAEKTNLYAPQLKLYARALARIYRRPVSRLFLYFLHAQQPVGVPPE